MEHDYKPNGYRPKSFGDVILLITFIISGLVWGIKLEVDIRDDREETARVARAISAGVLPRADERLRSLERDLMKLESEFRAFERYHDENFVPARALEPRRN
jgi:hypothetical protein